MGSVDAFRLDGQVAYISGGSGAIGAAIGAAFASAGASVVIGGTDAGRCEAAAAGVRQAGGDSLAIVTDATDPAKAEEVVARTLDRFGRLDILVNAVGGGAGKVVFPAEGYPHEAWDWIMRLNLTSTLVATQPVARQMIAAGTRGRILNISSVRAQLGIRTGYSAYVAAKGAVSSLTRQWAVEWAKHGITVNAISPTFVDTPQVASLLADATFKQGLVDRIPLGRIGSTDDIVGPALFFASPASAFVTGQILTIDGGLTATQ